MYTPYCSCSLVRTTTQVSLRWQRHVNHPHRSRIMSLMRRRCKRRPPITNHILLNNTIITSPFPKSFNKCGKAFNGMLVSRRRIRTTSKQRFRPPLHCCWDKSKRIFNRHKQPPRNNNSSRLVEVGAINNSNKAVAVVARPVRQTPLICTPCITQAYGNDVRLSCPMPFTTFMLVKFTKPPKI